MSDLSILNEVDQGQAIPDCPECGGTMIERFRRVDNKPFYGCNGYPDCKGIVNVDQKELPDPQRKKVDIPWSDFQKDVFAHIDRMEENAVIIAVAGSGKTTTIVEGTNHVPRNMDVTYLAFNRKIVNDLKPRLPSHIRAATTHSFGLKNITQHLGKVKVDNRKIWYLMDDWMSENRTIELREYKAPTRNLIALLKNTMMEPNYESLEWLCDRYGVQTNDEQELIFDAVLDIFHESILSKEMVDFDDMIYYSATNIVPCKKHDVLFIDEAQDLNRAQIELTLRSVREGGRIICVGDPNQSVYGFRGADVEAIPRIIKAIEAQQLPLSITYRCPTKHVVLAQKLVPEITAAPDAKEGIIETVPMDFLLDNAKDADLVLCRTNAPLVPPCFAMIRRGIKAVILGRDIGVGLVRLVDKVGKRNTSESLGDLMGALAEYRTREMSKLIKAKKDYRAALIDDQVETIIALADGVRTIQELKEKIEMVFDDTARGVIFSSVHKAKGAEAENVYILRHDLMPHPMAKSDWECEQELNIIYVAYTRAKNALYFVA